MNDRENMAYQDGKEAALRGDLLSRHEVSYKRSPGLWRLFQLGYLDAQKERIRALNRARTDARHAHKTSPDGVGQ